MSSKQDLLLRLDSEFNDKGFKKAEDSARVLERELAKQERAERQLANLQIAAQRENEARQARQLAGMEAVGRGFTAVGLLAAAGLGVAAKAAMDWETAWAGVTKTVDGTPEQMAALEKELRALATTLPATHEEIAGVAEAAGQLGVKRQDVAAFTKTMIDLGVSTNLSADEAATGLAQLANIMGTLPSEVGRAGAALVALGNDGASTERDILEMSLRIAGAGKTIGLTEAQVMGFANALASMGIEAEAGGSAISRVMVTIASSVDEGGESLATFAKVAGMTSDQFSTRFRTDAAGAVAAFVEGLGRMQKSGQSVFAVLKDLNLSEIRVRDTLLRAASAGDLVTKSLQNGTKAWQDNAALLAEANKRYETTESRLRTTGNQLNDMGISLGATVLPALVSVADKVGALATAFEMLPDPVKEGVTIFGGLLATIGLMGGAALIAIPKLAAMNATLAATGPAGARAAAGISAAGRAMLGPWGLALAGATIALGIFAEQQGEAKQRAQELADTLDKVTGAVTEMSRVNVRNTLFDQGVLDAADKLGLSLADVVDASLGMQEPLDRVNGLLAAQSEENSKLGTSAIRGADAQRYLGDSVNKVRSAISGGNKDIAAATEEWRLKAATERDAADASGEAADATDTLTGAQKSNAEATERARKELDKLVQAVEGYGDTVNAALDAQSGYEAAIDSANKAIAENGKTANKARTAISLHTEAGRDNDKALRDVASSALKAATANFQNGRSVKSVTGDVMKARDQFVTMAQKMGLSKDAANALADQLGLTRGNVQTLNTEIGKTPASKTVTMKAETERALAEVKAFQAAINALHGKTVTVRYTRVGANPGGGRSTAGGSTFDSAEGNLFEYSGSFRRGGYAPIGSMQPQTRLAGGDGLRWSEQGAGPWEAFISGNPAKRDRSLAIWEDTGRRLGAFEAMRSQPAVMVQGAKTIDRSMHIGQVNGLSAADVVREVGRQQAKHDALHPEFG